MQAQEAQPSSSVDARHKPEAPPGATQTDPVENARAAPARKRRGRIAFFVLGGVVLLVVGGIGVHLVATRDEESTDDAQVEADVVSLAPRTGGQIAHVLVHSDQHVRAGEPLVELDDADLRARVASASAELASAAAQIEAAEAEERIVEATAQGGLVSARAMVTGTQAAMSSAADQVATARAEVTRAESDLQRTELDYARAQRLATTGAVSQQQVDYAQLARTSAQAALDRARASLAGAQSARRGAATQIAAAQGRLAQSQPVAARIAAAHAATSLARAHRDQAEAALALANLQLSYAHVVAPVTGTVSNLNAEAGQIVVAGQPLASLVPDESYVVANFKETQIGRMRPGDRAEIELDAYRGRTLEGVVTTLSAGTGARFSVLPPSNATGNFVKVVQRVPVRVAWRRRPGVPLHVGLSATVTVHVGEHEASR